MSVKTTSFWGSFFAEFMTPQEMLQQDLNDTLTVSSAEQYVEWKIPDFLSLPQKKDDCLDSTLFHFFDETWFLSIFPRREEFGSRYITAYLCKKNFDKKTDGIQYRTGIKKSDGSEYFTSSVEAELFEDYMSEDDIPVSYESEFEHNVSESESESEDDESESEDYIRTATELVKRSVLRKKSTELLPHGVLTVFCILRANKSRNKEANTQPRIPADFEKLSDDFKDLFLNEKGSDVTLKVMDCEFKVHKAILRARSTVFDSMFTDDMEENIINISDCLPETFGDLLLYMYCGNTEKISTNNIFGLYRAADKFDVTKLKEKCVQLMTDSLSVGTFCDVLALALRYNESAMATKARKFFVNNEKKIIATGKWLCFLKSHPVEANALHKKALTIFK